MCAIVFREHPPGPVIWKNRGLVESLLPAAAHWLEHGGFGEEWRAQALWEHRVARAMSLRAGVFAEFLADVGDLVRCVHLALEGADPVIASLQSPPTFEGALLEARAARLLVEAGLPFCFVPEPNDARSHDIHVPASEGAFNLEVKGVLLADRVAVARELSHWAITNLPLRDLGVAMEFLWNGPEVDELDLGGTIPWETIRGLGSKARPILEAALREPIEDARRLRLAGLGSVLLRPLSQEEVTEGRVCWIQYTLEPSTPHRLRRALSRATKQLPTDVPGVILLATNPNLYDDATCTAAVEEWFHGPDSSKRRHVVAVLVLLTAHLNEGVIERPVVIRNPDTWGPVPAFLSRLGPRAITAEPEPERAR
ncbi:MAG: hypothetical protein JJ863_17650 [Deltaproteobacteria bacterium]|nr:hypothetical protein [Deltaproteobacteria bacterium]